MQLDAMWIASLGDSEEYFSAGRSFPVRAEGWRTATRFDLLRQIVVGRSVLHVGCVDHLSLIDQKIDTGTWMHEVLHQSASRLGGIDVNGAGIARLKERGYANLYVGDVSRPCEQLLGGGWEVLFLGEVIEHTDDPIGFLRDIRHAWGETVENVVISVPNAFAWDSLRGAMHSTEVINTDHRFWFTPFTATKVAARAGFKVESIHMCETAPGNPNARPLSRVKQKMLNLVLARRPIFQRCIVLVLTAQ